jgi:hypothetical protein
VVAGGESLEEGGVSWWRRFSPSNIGEAIGDCSSFLHQSAEFDRGDHRRGARSQDLISVSGLNWYW